MRFGDPEEPHPGWEEPYAWTDLEVWQDFWSEVRGLYSVPMLREWLGLPLEAGQQEPWADVVLFVSHFLTGQTEDLLAAKEWFQERIPQDYPEAGSSHCDDVLSTENGGGYDVFALVGREQGVEKITHMLPVVEESPPCIPEESPACTPEKSPSDGIPVGAWLVVSAEDLAKRLRRAGQGEWCTRVRLSGLLLLIDFVVRNTKRTGVRISLDLAHGYVSAIKLPKSKRTEREPLRVLEIAGILEKVSGAAVGPYSKCSAAYRIAAAFLKCKRHSEIFVTPLLAKKLETAPSRKDRRLNSKQPWRKALLEALPRVDLSPQGANLALDLLLSENNKKEAVQRLLDVLRNRGKMRISCSPGDHITTSLSGCPRELKPELLIAGESVALCDIRAAHFCVLPRIIEDVIDRGDLRTSREIDEEELCREKTRLVAVLSEEDIYRCLSEDPASDTARITAKGQVLKVLNLRNQWARKSPIYQRLQKLFPQVTRFLEWYKRDDHKAIQAPLRFYTALVINKALLRLQERGVPAIPDSDCLICPASQRSLASKLIGEEMMRVSGVRCVVDGVRF